MLPLLRHAIFAIRSLPSRGRSPASGSRNHRAALYCRQTDSAAAEASAVEDYSVCGFKEARSKNINLVGDSFSSFPSGMNPFLR